MSPTLLHFDLVFHVNKDSVVNKNNLHKSLEDLTVNSSIELPTVSRVGAEFKGWNIAPDPDSTNGYSNLYDLQYNVLKDIPLANVTVNQKIVYNLYPVWEANSNQASYTVTTNIPASQGQFVIYQLFDSDSIKRVVDGDHSVELIKDYDIVYYVKFEPAFGYTLATDARDTVSYYDGTSKETAHHIKNDSLYRFIDSTGVTPLTAVLSVRGLSADAYELTFNANAGNSDVFYGDSWQSYINQNASESNGALTVKLSYSDAFPMALYRVGKCLEGYTFTADNATETAYNALTQAFVEKLTALGNVGKATLYAKWSDCDNSAKVYTVVSNDAGMGTFKLTRQFALNSLTSTAPRSYEVPATGFKVASEGDVSFTGIEFTLDASVTDYVLDNEDPYMYKTSSATTWTEIMGAFDVNEDITLKAPLVKSVYEFAYNRNALGADSSKVFFSKDLEKSATYTLDNAGDFKELQPTTVMGRTDACLTGWALDRAGSKVLSKYDIGALRTLASASKTDTLYAVWTAKGTGCTPTTFKVTTKVDAAKGEFKVYQVLAPEDTLWYKVDATDGIEIPTVEGLQLGVKFFGAAGYTLGTNVSIDDGTTTKTLANGGMFEVLSGQNNVKLDITTKAVDYHFAFNENSAGLNSLPYFGDSWQTRINSATFKEDENNGNWIVAADYAVNGNKSFPMDLYSDEVCLRGYAATATETDENKIFTELNDSLIKLYEGGAYTSNDTMMLYAIWGVCPAGYETQLISFADLTKGKYEFYRTFSLGNAKTLSRTYVVSSANAATGFKMPVANANDEISFTNWAFVVDDDEDYIVDTDSAFVYRAGTSYDWNKMDANSLFSMAGVKYIKAPLLKNFYTFNYDKNHANDREVFYSPKMVDIKSYSIASISESMPMQSTTVLGRTDACLTGWSFDGTENRIIGDTFNAETLRKINALDARNEDIETLYAVWTKSGETDASGKVCTPKTFKVTTQMDAEQGTFEVYRKIGNMTTLYSVGANGIEIPVLKDMELGVQFTAVSQAYSFGDDVTVDDGVTPITVVNGKTFKVAGEQKNVVLSVTTGAVEYELAFNENAEGKAYFADSWFAGINSGSFSEGTDHNWSVARTYSVTMNDAEKAFPMAMYRDGKCLQGYTFTADSDEGGVFQKFDDDFINAFKAYGNTAGVTTLYAYWGACTAANSATVKLADTDKGSYKFTRTFDLGNGSTAVRTYTVANENFVVPSANGDIAFDGVQFEVSATNYILDTDAKLSVKGSAATASWTDYTDGDMLTVGVELDSVKAPLLKNTYTFTYDKNFAKDSAVFYSPDVEFSGTYTLANISDTKPLQSKDLMGRADACLTGWSLDAAGKNVIGVFDVNALRMLDTLSAKNVDVSTLYAVWTAKGTGCSPTTFKVTTTKPADQGSFKLYRVFDGDTAWYNVGSNGFEIPTLENMELGVLFSAASPAYSLGGSVTVDDGVTPITVANGKTFKVADGQKNVSLDMRTDAVKYELAFNENDAGVAYFGDSWADLINKTSFSVTTDGNENWTVAKTFRVDMTAEAKRFPMALYRADRCLQGYTFTEGDRVNVFTALDSAFIAKFAELGKEPSDTTMLYALWKECKPDSVIVELDGTDKGFYTFTRKFSLGTNNGYTPERVYEVDSANYKIPSKKDDISFTGMKFKVDAAGYILDTEAKLSVKAVADTAKWRNYDETKLLTVNERFGYAKAPILKSAYTFAYNKNFAKDSAVFYSPDVKFSGTYTLASVTGFESLQSTDVMGRADACLTGWSLDAAGKNVIGLFDVNALRMLDTLSAKNVDVSTLYAVWTAKGTGCSPTTFTVASGVPESQGSFKAYRLFDGDTTWYNLGTNGIAIPTFKGMALGFKFTVASTYNLDADVSVTDANGIVKRVANGDTIHVAANQTNLTLRTEPKAVKYYFAFNENSNGKAFFGDAWKSLFTSTTLTTDAKKNWVVTAAYTVESESKEFPKALYSDGQCLDGYTLVAGNKNSGWFTELNDELIAKYEAAGSSSNKPLTLYAFWGTCATANSTTINLADTDKGSYKFTSSFALGDGTSAERTYTTSNASFVIPSANNDVSFNDVVFDVASSDVILDTDAKIQVKGTAATADWTDYTAGDALTVGDNLGSVKAPLLKNSYTFAYDKNFAKDSAVFYSPSVKFSGTYTIADVSESQSLQETTVMARTDACLSGWALDAAGSKVIRKFDANALRTINRLEIAGTDVNTLYAVWTNKGDLDLDGNVCDPTTFTVATNMTEDQGSFQVYRVLGDNITWYDLGTDGLEIPTLPEMVLGIKFTGASTYTFGTSIFVDDGTANARYVNIGDTIHVAAAQKNLMLKMKAEAVKYFFAFNENSAGKAFFGDAWESLITSETFKTDNDGNWIVTDKFTVESVNLTFPKSLYRTDKCLEGYTLAAGNKNSGWFTGLNDELIAKYEAAGSDSSKPFMLYAYWTDCDVANSVTVKLADSDKGTYKFTRTFTSGDFTTPVREYEIANADFVVPSASKDISFNGVEFKVTATDVIFDTDAKIQVKGAAATATWSDYTAGDKLTAGASLGSVKVPLLKNTYKFVYDMNWDDVKNVFVSSRKADTATYTIASVSDSIELQSTTLMGRTDACLTGWSLDKAGNTVIRKYNASALRTLDEFVKSNKSVDTLYAVWTDDGVGGCSPMTFTVKSGVDAAKGSFQVYQETDADASGKFWYDVPNNGITIPVVPGLMLGVKFTEVSAAYTFGDNVSVDVANAAGQIIPNEGTFEVLSGQQNVTLNVTSGAVTYTLAFNENDVGEAYFGDSWAGYINDATFSMDLDSNWIVKANYSVNSENKNFPMAMYRKGMCLQGYTFEPGERTDGVYSDLSDKFIKTLKALNKNPAATTLYALWGRCSGPDSSIVALEGTTNGSYKFTRTFALSDTKNTPARSYVVSDASFKVPSSHGDVSFNGVEFLVSDVAGVILDTQAKTQVKATATAAWVDYTDGDKLTAGVNLAAVKAPLLKNAYRFAYDKNFAKDSAVFYSPSVVFSDLYTIADVSQSRGLQETTVMARADACLTGWALDKDGNNIIGVFDGETLRKLDSLSAKNVDVSTLYAVWTKKGTGCTPTTFKVSTEMPAAQGSFKAYRVFDAETTWYNVGTNGIEIPTLEGMALGFKFTGATTYNFGNSISVDDGVNARGIGNGDTIHVAVAQKNLKLGMQAEAVKYYFAFNENAGNASVYFGDSWETLIDQTTFKTDDDGNWVVKKDYTVESLNKGFPMDLYNGALCMQGYGFSSNSYTAFTELNDAVIAEYNRSAIPHDSDNPMMLYAVWGACATSSNVTVNLAGTDKGSYKFSRTFSSGNFTTPVREYVVTDADFVVPSANKNVSFNGVEFTVTSSDVIFDTDAKVQVKGSATTASWSDYADGEKLTAGANLASVKAPLLKNSYKFVYDKNWNDAKEVFFSTFMVDTATYTIASVSDAIELQSTKVMGRTDACLTGWALDKAGRTVIGAFDGDALRTLDEFVKSNKSVDTLYAVWTDDGVGGCSPTTFTVKSGVDAAKGSFQVYQETDADASGKFWYNVENNGVQIPVVPGLMLGVKFTEASAAYTYGKNVSVDVANAAGQIIPNEGTFEVLSGQQNVTLNVTSAAVTYTLAFNENDVGEAYFGDSWADYINDATFSMDVDSNWIVKANYSVNSTNKKFPMAMYRNGMCLQGYTFEPGDMTDGVYSELNDKFIKTLKALNKNPAATTLYALWGRCSGPDSSIVALDGTTNGSYKFTRTFALSDPKNTPARSYVVSDASFKVPSSHGDVSFNGVEFLVSDVAGVILDTQAKIQVKATATAAWADYTDGDMLTAGANLAAVKAPLLKNSYRFAYDKNFAKDSAVFYSPNMKYSETYSIASVAESKSLQTLDVMARTDACLTGWALDKAGKTVIGAFDGEALRTLNAATSTDTLYAVWTKKGVNGCKPTTFTVSTEIPVAQGSFKVFRAIGDDITWYDMGTSGIEIPTMADMVLGFKFTGATTYNFGTIISVNDGTSARDINNGDTIHVAAVQKNLTLSMNAEAVKYFFAFNENTAGTAYFGDSWESLITPSTFKMDGEGNWVVTKNYTVESSVKKFPMAIYRDGSCLQGYTLAAGDKTDGLFTELNDALIAKYQAARSDSATPLKLFAFWGTCSAANSVTVKLADTDKGTYKFTRTFALGDGKFAERTYEAATANFAVPSANKDVSFNNIAFEVNDIADVILDTDAKLSVKGTAATADWADYTEGDKLTAGVGLGSVKVPLLKNTYTFAYAKNYAVDSAVFYSPNMVESATYTIANVAESKSLQTLDVMARTDACLTGWSLDKAGKTVIGTFDAEALRTLNAATATETLYAVWTKKGVNGCKPTTFTVTSAMPAAQGSFKVYRLLGNDTTWYNVGTNGIEIPTLEKMELGVKFIAASTAYTFGSDVIGNDASGTRLFSTKNGNMFTVAAAQKSVKLAVTSSKVDYTFAFNENASGKAYFGDSWSAYINDASFSTDKAGNWIVKAGYSVESSDKKFPMAIYRDGSCLQGYTFAANDKTDGIYTELSDAFIAKFAALGKNAAATPLYAFWGTCSAANSVTVKLADTDKGTYKFTRTFALGNGKFAERTYEAASADFTVPSANKDVSFNAAAFAVKSGSGVILDTDAKLSVKGTAATSAWTDYTDGDVLTAGANLGSVKTPLLKNSYTFAYAKNYAVDSAVFYSPNMKNSGTYTIASVAESKSLQTLDVMARTDACLTGWSLDKAGKTVIGTFDAEALRTLNAATATDTLYAVWTKKGTSGCSPTTFTLTSAMPAAQGSFKVYRVLGSDTTWYNVGTNGIEIPTVEKMKLGVKFTAASPAYTFGSNVAGADASGTTLFNIKNGNMFTVAAAQKNAKLSVTSDVVTYTFAFNANAGKASVFSGVDFATTGKFVIGDALPMNLYRNDAKLVGWSFEPLTGAVSGKVFTNLSDEFVNAFENRAKADTLYAVWAVDNARKTYTIAITNLVEEGSFELKNASSVYTVKPGETLTVPSENDLLFAVSFKPNSYNKNEYTGIEVLDAKSGKLLTTVNTGDTYKFVSNVSLRAVGKFSAVQFALNTNAGTNKVFFGDAFKEFAWTAKSFEDVLPTEIYRTDAVLVGWSFDKNATKGSVTYDETLAESYNTFRSNKSNANKTPVLYAVWQKKTVPTITVKADSAAKGSLTLTQFVGESSFAHAVSEKGMAVPSVDNGLIFKAHFDVNGSWSMNANKPLVWTTAKAKDSTANDAFKVVKTDVTVKVLAVFKEFHFVFSVSGDSLFYGDDWKKSGDFASTEDKNETMFPTMVYNMDSCVAGWSVKIGTTSYTNLQDSMISDLYAVYPNINSSMNVKLYAEWTDKVDDCAGNITRITVKQQHGDVHLVENMAKAKLVHKFNKYGSMLLPSEIESDNWTVRTNPDSSFVLDSLVVERDGKKEAVLHEGDHLPTNMEKVQLYAYFGKANKTPIEILDTNFAQSGNAVRVGFRTSAFEVTRAVSGRVRITDAKGVMVLDSLLGDSLASAFADEVIMRVNKPGTYKMRLTFSDRKESAEYGKQFTVNAQMASFGAESWHMISLAPVDTSAIVWNDYNRFYWWDDSYCGEFWQYKTFNRGDEIVGTRGVWYSSQDGTPLVIRDDIEDDGEDIVWELDSIGSGWNLVANPHGWRVNLFGLNGYDRKNVDEKSEISFWRYNAETSEYVEADTLEPYEAVWAKVSTKKAQWAVSAKPIFTFSRAADSSKNGLSKRTLAKATTKDRWTLQAVLEDRNGHRDSWNILGVSNNPFVAEEPPTSFGDHVNLSIVEGKHGLAKSIKDADAEKEWTVALSATSSRTGYLSFVGIKDINAFGYHVYVTVDGTTTEMKEGTPLQVSLSSNPKNATVRVERGTIAVAQKSGLKGLRSAKLGNQLHVSFEVPDELVNESTRVELLSAKGGVVATASARSVFGTNKVMMDVPKNGVYILRVRVGSAQVTRQILVK